MSKTLYLNLIVNVRWWPATCEAYTVIVMLVKILFEERDIYRKKYLRATESVQSLGWLVKPIKVYLNK